MGGVVRITMFFEYGKMRGVQNLSVRTILGNILLVLANCSFIEYFYVNCLTAWSVRRKSYIKRRKRGES